jgi:hypothetical protein
VLLLVVDCVGPAGVGPQTTADKTTRNGTAHRKNLMMRIAILNWGEANTILTCQRRRQSSVREGDITTAPTLMSVPVLTSF